jgi:RHS repeat-associated protein
MIKKVDGNGNWTCYIYDALHRLTDVGNNAQSATNPCKRFRYDNSPGIGLGGTKPSGLINTMGRLIEAATDTCSGTDTIITDEWFSYTARGEVSDFYESTPHSGGYYHNSATYWANGVLNQLNAASGYFAQYNVDGEGRIYSTAPSIGALNSTTYNAAGQPTLVTFASNDSDSFAYDSNTGRMTQYKFTIGATPQSLIGNLTWNANGTLASQNITDPFNSLDTQNCSYTHDDLSRIASVNCGAALSQTFGYDAFGNITKAGNYNFNPTYNSATNRYASIPGVTVSYDTAGNLLSDGTHSYAWDAYGRPVTVDGVGLTYDAFGRMVEQNRSGSYAEINYAPTGDKIELMNGQSYTKAFVPLPGGAVAVYGEPTVAFRQADHLGNIKLNSTTSRTVTWSLAYAPFGETYASSGSPDRAFTSQRQDTVTPGLYDFPAREYSIQGRWPSPDPAGLAAVNPSNPQSWNRYAYVLNSPCNMVDPYGLAPCTFNITIINNGLNRSQLQTAESQIASFLSGAGVGVTFNQGKPDYTATLTIADSPKGPENFGDTPLTWGGLGGPGNKGTIYTYNTAVMLNKQMMNATATNVARAVGEVLTHEFGHWALNYTHSPDENLAANDIMQRDITSDFPYQNYRFSSEEATKLQIKCKEKHPTGGGGGGGGSRGGVGGDDWLFELWWNWFLSNPIEVVTHRFL